MGHLAYPTVSTPTRPLYESIPPDGSLLRVRHLPLASLRYGSNWTRQPHHILSAIPLLGDTPGRDTFGTRNTHPPRPIRWRFHGRHPSTVSVADSRQWSIVSSGTRIWENKSLGTAETVGGTGVNVNTSHGGR